MSCCNFFHYSSAEIIVAISVLLITVFGSCFNKYIKNRAYPIFAIFALLISIYTVSYNFDFDKVFLFYNLSIASKFVSLAKIVILCASISSILLALGYIKIDKIFDQYEYYVMILLSTLGMMIMVSSNDLMTLYLGLELMSLSLYAMVSFSRNSIISSEAGLKYFILGALASGILLYGSSLVYGFTGTTNFSAIGTLYQKYSLGSEMPIAVLVGFLLIIASICFKIAAAPFHMWAPDVYQGAPLPVTAFLSTAPKAASLLLLVKLLLSNFAPLHYAWIQVIGSVACLSLIVGALGALMQSNIKRLLAYSSISHIGFMLIGLVSFNFAGAEATIIYLCIYITMNLGMFAFIAILQSRGNENFDLSIIKGLSKTNPIIALCISILLFSMAGIPPLAGFLAKFYVIFAAIRAELYFIAIFAMLSAVVSTYYYLKIVKYMYFDDREIRISDNTYSVGNIIIASFATTFNVILVLFPTSLTKLISFSMTSLFE